LPGIFWREAAAEHRRDQLHPLRVVLQTAGSDLLVGADGNMLYGDDINHFFQAVDIFFEAREEVPDADCTARLGNRPRVVAADLPSVSGVGPIAGEPESAVCDKSRGLVATLTACFTASSVACATSQTKPSRWQRGSPQPRTRSAPDA